MKSLAILAFLAAVMLLLVNSQPSPSPERAETNGDRWQRMCAVEAPSAVDDCVTKHALGAAFAKTNADFDKRLRDAAR